MRVGTRDFLVGHGIRVPVANGADVLTTVHVARGTAWLGAIELADPPRAEAAKAVAELRALGLEVMILSGGAPGPVRQTALAVGLPAAAALARQSPEAKLERVRAAARPVGFVGDGLNDGPALAAAEVGVAVREATDLARSAAAITLARADIERLPQLIRLARRARRLMRQNIVWAVGYNLLAVPAAVFGLIDPLLAAAAMGASSLSVTLNSWRAGRRP